MSHYILPLYQIHVNHQNLKEHGDQLISVFHKHTELEIMAKSASEALVCENKKYLALTGFPNEC